VEALDKIKYFPNETLIFPQKLVDLRDLQFASSVDPDNDIIKMKMELLSKSNESDRLLPTTLIEEKNSNPFLNPLKFKKLLGVSDKFKCFGMLRKLRRQMFPT
jgi:hydroxyacylglutathione hydrolase